MLFVDIKKKLGKFVLDVNFNTNSETLALFGPSGCGKSMTLKCIAGLETPDEGIIQLNGRTLFDSSKKINLRPQERKIGLLFQNYALFPNMTLKQNIAIGVPKATKNKEDIIEEIIRDFHLEGLDNNYPHQLSGGQQQRTALARMLVNSPEMLMLDEPFSALDDYLRWQMEQELISILKKHKGSALYVSHNGDEVFRISDKIAIMNNGKIEEIDGKEELFNNPKSKYTAILTGCKNISKASKINDYEVYAKDWGIRIKSSKHIKDNVKNVGFYQDGITLISDKKCENLFRLKIKDIAINRSTSTLILENYNSKYIYLEISNKELKAIGKCEHIDVNIDKDRLLLLT